MGDLFHEDVPEWQIDRVFERVLHDGVTHHTFQILTKWADRMAEYCSQRHIKTFLETASNIWLGVSVENQQEAQKRIPQLLRTSDVLKFVNVEPMLARIDLSEWLYGVSGCKHPLLGWVICGGETGPGAREMRPEWAKELKEQCESAGVPFFMKQMSKKVAIPPYLQSRDFPQG